MGFWSWLTGVGRSIGNFVHNVATTVWTGVKWVSKQIGSVEHWFDKALEFAHNVPILRDIADTIENSDIYHSVRGVVDDVRGIIESDQADQIASGVAELTRPSKEEEVDHKRKESDYHPIHTLPVGVGNGGLSLSEANAPRSLGPTPVPAPIQIPSYSPPTGSLPIPPPPPSNAGSAVR